MKIPPRLKGRTASWGAFGMAALAALGAIALGPPQRRGPRQRGDLPPLNDADAKGRDHPVGDTDPATERRTRK